MITFVLAAAVLIGALCIAVALDGATTEAPPGVVHVLAAGCSRQVRRRRSHGVCASVQIAEELDAVHL
jgi:hypothetical protein